MDTLNAALVGQTNATKTAGGGAAWRSDAANRRIAASRAPAVRTGPASRAGPETNQTNLAPLVPHQHRQIGVREHVTRHTTEDQLPQWAMRIRAHD